MNKAKNITAIYEDKFKAQKALQLLEKNGYDEDQVSLLVAKNSWSGESMKIEESTKAPEGTAMGAGIGGALGALAGGLTAVGTITATGGAGLLAAGPVVGALAGAGSGGAAGGIIGGLIGLGYPETEAKFVDEKVGKGHVLLAVAVDKDEEDFVKNILDKSDPEKITTH